MIFDPTPSDVFMTYDCDRFSESEVDILKRKSPISIYPLFEDKKMDMLYDRNILSEEFGDFLNEIVCILDEYIDANLFHETVDVPFLTLRVTYEDISCSVEIFRSGEVYRAAIFTSTRYDPLIRLEDHPFDDKQKAVKEMLEWFVSRSNEST